MEMLERTVKRAEKRDELEDIDKIARRRLDENIGLESCSEKVEIERK